MTATSLIRSFGARIERLNEEIKSLNADKAEIYAEAKAQGLDQKALKLALKAKADLEKNPEAVRELEFNVEAYLGALMGGGGETGTPLATRARARENCEHDQDTGEITEPQLPGEMVADDLELPDFLRRKKEAA